MKKPLFFLVCFALVTAGVFTGWGEFLDKAVYSAARNLASPEFLRFNRAVTFFGGSLFAYTAGAGLALVLVCREKILRGLLFYLWFWAGTGLNYSLKLFFSRARPEFLDHGLTLKSWAYPSGHAFNAAALFLMGTTLFSKSRGVRGAAIAGALAVGGSRLFLGVHWASDVLGGLFLGLFWAALYEKYEKIASVRF